MTALSDLLAFYSGFPGWAEIECRLDRPNNFGDFPINVAATRCAIDELQVLIDAGADINQIGEHGFTPLLNAVEQGCSAVVLFLLEKGADPHLSNADGMTAAMLADLLQENEIAALLRSWKSRAT